MGPFSKTTVASSNSNSNSSGGGSGGNIVVVEGIPSNNNNDNKKGSFHQRIILPHFSGRSGTNSSAADAKVNTSLADEDDDDGSGSGGNRGTGLGLAEVDSSDSRSTSTGSNSRGQKDYHHTSSSSNSSSNGLSTSSRSRQLLGMDLRRLAEKETIFITGLWLLLLSSLIIAGIFVAQGTFRFATNEEEAHFEQEFIYLANNVARQASNRLATAEIQLQTHATAISLLALATSTSIDTYSNTTTGTSSSPSWPFVTVARTFEQTGQNVLQITGGMKCLTAHFVTELERGQWEDYSVQNQHWIQTGLDYHINNGLIETTPDGFVPDAKPISSYIHVGRPEDMPRDPPQRDPGPPSSSSKHDLYAPIWQISPAPVENPDEVNYNLYADPIFAQALNQMMDKKASVLTDFITISSTGDSGTAARLFSDSKDSINQQLQQQQPPPKSCLIYPIRKGGRSSAGNTHNSSIVAAVLNLFTWDVFFENIVHDDQSMSVILILENACGQVHTYSINGPNVTYVGEGDRHDPDFSHLGISQTLRAPGTGVLSSLDNVDDDDSTSSGDDPCPYLATLYPSEGFRGAYESNDSYIYATGVASIFGLSICCFLIYGSCVERRQKDNLESALRVHAIVGSLFPRQVLNRLLNEQEGSRQGRNKANGGKSPAIPVGVTVSAALEVDATTAASTVPSNMPIADLFPNCTVMYGDLVGFTAWSSAREPTQVFTLLETVYYCFDELARKRRVFKVETIGDCYVAVVGLPDPRKHHATIMARFANDCLVKLREVVNSLEIELGPETADLSMRFGINSGPVIAGVLRGEKSRFQLFGDTVALAADMEHFGTTNRIHISQHTADLLTAAGKGKWVKPRDDLVNVDGKREIQTYWLSITVESVYSEPSSFASSDQSSTSGESFGEFENDFTNNNLPLGQMVDINGRNGVLTERTKRAVDWMVEMLGRSLKKIVAMRNDDIIPDAAAVDLFGMEGTVLDEVKEIIQLPGKPCRYKRNPEAVELNDVVKTQLKDYVEKIASMYRDVPFHGFEHASHVTMSVGKLLSRIVATKEIDYNDMTYKNEEDHMVLHENTYGITSDPLTQFALSFSALIHDVDHTGVPNATLVKEKAALAELYNDKSVAEQNSVDLAWDLFIEPQYNALRACICPTEEEYQRFRQLVVNTVMATDIVDKELGALRKQRWNVAFDETTVDENPLDTVNRKATIVIEHLMQASDVAHTMQHWHVYQKWNERFFQECYKAYKDGRADKDPSIGWYKGEIGFFDFYIIPLAKKLKDCGVFGVSSDEYLNYAQKNRDEWELKGEQLVAEFLTRYEETFGLTSSSGSSSGSGSEALNDEEGSHHNDES